MGERSNLKPRMQSVDSCTLIRLEAGPSKPLLRAASADMSVSAVHAQEAFAVPRRVIRYNLGDLATGKEPISLWRTISPYFR